MLPVSGSDGCCGERVALYTPLKVVWLSLGHVHHEEGKGTKT